MFGAAFDALKGIPGFMQKMQQNGTFANMMGDGLPQQAQGNGFGLGQQMPQPGMSMMGGQVTPQTQPGPQMPMGTPPGLGGGLPQQAQGNGFGLGQQMPGLPPMQQPGMQPGAQGSFASMMGGQPGAQPRGDFASMLGRLGQQMMQRQQGQQQRPQMQLPIAGQGRQMPQGNRQLEMANLMRQRQVGRMFSR